MDYLPSEQKKQYPGLRLLGDARLWLIVFAVISATGLNAQPRVPDSTVVFSTADTYVRSTGTDADANFSNDSIIKARYSTSSAYHELGLLKFDLTNSPDLRYEAIDSVKLVLTLVYEQVAGAYTTILGIPDAADSWNATAVTWNSGRPDTTGTLARASLPKMATQVASADGLPVRFDITSRFIGDIKNGNGVLSLGVFTERNAGANTYFLSSESALIRARPKLIVYTHRGAVTSGPRNLNVVYFLPTDADTVAAYQQRLNGILYQAQNFYRKWMQYWGYGNRSFGLRQDDQGRVKIVVIHGAHDKAYYPYTGGGNKAKLEIEAYFATHPEDKQSTHTLVMFPPNIDSSGGEDVPFYGIGGGWCFALDNPDIDTTYTGSSNYIGGMIHELGHGLNLPHVRQKVSELADPALGTSLMGSGNYTYRKHPTFLTASSCAILNNCEVFAAVTPPADLYEPTVASLIRVHGSYGSGNITLNGKFASSKPVNQIVVYNDPDGGDNYDRESWVSPVVGTDSFSVVMPISELHKKEGNYKLVIALLCSNGATKEFNFSYYFENNAPVIHLEVDNYIDTVGSKVYLAPTDDSYGIYADKAGVHGADSLIQIRYSQATAQTYNKIGFLKFDLHQLSLPAGAVIKNILVQAKLQYHQLGSGYNINVLAIADGMDAWSEASLTWNNRPDTLATIARAAVQPVGTLLSWVVTDAAKAELDPNTGNGILSLALYTDLNSAANTWFYSKESANALDHPKLMVVYTLPGSEQDAGQVALPVDPLDLMVSKTAHQVQLQWTALPPDRNQVFLIQRSTDGKRFETISTVSASGGNDYLNPDAGLSGAFESKNALAFKTDAGLNKYKYRYQEVQTGTRYYRIAVKKVDQQSGFRFSNIRVLHFYESGLADGLKLYPNPAPENGKVQLEFNNVTGLTAVTLRIAGNNGRVVRRQKFNLSGGINRLQVDLSGAGKSTRLSPGVYFISLQGQGLGHDPSGSDPLMAPLTLLIK